MEQSGRLAATACAALVLLAALIVYQITVPVMTPPTPSYVAVLVNDQKAPMIVAIATRHPQRMVIIMMKKPKGPPNKDLELWAIPQTGTPVSIGLLSKRQETLVELNAREMRVIPKTTMLAISREPKGGSPTSGPTGPVVYQG